MKRFTEEELNSFIGSLTLKGYHSIKMWCGPLDVVEMVRTGYKSGNELQSVRCNYDGEGKHLVGTEGLPIRVGSGRWYGRRYFNWRCLHGIFRYFGFFDKEWNRPDPCVDIDDYLAVVEQNIPNLRMEFPYGDNELLVVHDLSKMTYMKVLPTPKEMTTRVGNSIPKVWVPVLKVKADAKRSTDASMAASEEDIKLPTAEELGEDLGFVQIWESRKA